MSKRNRYPKTTPKQWAKQLFAQPSEALYQKPSMYLSGDELELQNFRSLVDYNENYLLLDLGRTRLRITGDALAILALEPARLVMRGQILSISFSEE